MRESVNTKTLRLATYCQLTTIDLLRRSRRRLQAEDGQTSAEYLGIILVVVAVIAAIAATGIGEAVSDKIKEAVDSVKAGDS